MYMCKDVHEHNCYMCVSIHVLMYLCIIESMDFCKWGWPGHSIDVLHCKNVNNSF